MTEDKNLWEGLFDAIEGLSRINHGLLELLVAKGLVEKAEIDDMFGRLTREASDLPPTNPVRIAIEAAQDDAAMLFSPEWIAALRARHRRLFPKKD